ncbi:hypothetical protein CUV01_07355 [Paracoccus tegillarcae]|uniref:Uncharacterized protein n=2 Tax=Paracoccus tegillarcae TaxID=1529068 RepID=A0A2K9EJS2_9RHOB|nr:hypothetical protein CUV01_07355 [Paracoccus tegillarcae]
MALIVLISIVLVGAQVAMAEDRLSVPLPDVSALSEAEAEALTRELAEVNVITSNCADYPVTDGEWTLMTGTSDLLAAKLGMDPSEYDRAYFGPAFTLLDDPSSCGRIGPKAKPLIDRLVQMGGATEPAAN